MDIPLYQVDAFADALFQGNPAAICPLQSWLPTDLMQNIAMENNLSETAFLVGREDTYELRWFTPRHEVDLCGHATLAAAHVAFRNLTSKIDCITFHTRSGPLPVWRKGESYTLDFPALEMRPIKPPHALIAALGTSPLECHEGMDLLAVLGSEQEVQNLKPDQRLLEQLDTRGIIVTAPGQEVDFVSRFFAPRHGIDEDPVTGSAHCLLAPYWSKRLGKVSMSARQLSRRGGRIDCQLDGSRVRLTGRARLFMEGKIHLES